MKITKRLLVCLALLLSGLVSVAAAVDTVRMVALTGNNAPGTSEDFSCFYGNPSLNNVGQVVFYGSVSGLGVDATNNAGIWSEGGGSLALVAREGNSAPGTGMDFAGFRYAAISDAGRTSFGDAFPVGRGSHSKNLWTKEGGSLSITRSIEGGAPGTDADFFSFKFLAFNSAGRAAFSGVLTGAGVGENNDQGIWSEGSDGSLVLLARNGSGAPGTSGDFSYFFGPSLNDLGQTAFNGYTTSIREGIWSDRDGSLALVAGSGDQAPGTSAVFIDFDSPLLNNVGEIAFHGSLTDGEVGSGHGIWSEGSGPLALVAYSEDSAPDTIGYFSTFYELAFNDAGQTAFSAAVHGVTSPAGSTATGIWSEGSGTLALVAYSGNVAPGTNANFSDFKGIVPHINSTGRTAFYGRLTGAEIDFGNDIGLWAEDSLGVLTLIAREGDLINVSSGSIPDFRTISRLRFSEEGFNDLGQLMFQANFTDGTSGIFVSNVAAVPEPSSLLLLSLVAFVMQPRRLNREILT